ncbi:DUF1161 domain-containing protein [Variovorax sp. AFSI2.2]|uniref:DUF1161 domain-containing protein n=1 Tax=Variovorax sp. AFSI2.2 TaxID=3384160 RepID=UPI003EB9E698
MKLWSISMALAFAGAAHGAENCEALRAQIESKIAASGVTRFSVTTIDANAQANGQVVGSCDLGSKKIVYQREGAPAADGALARPAPAPANERILTECKDGTVTVGGSCKQ